MKKEIDPVDAHAGDVSWQLFFTTIDIEPNERLIADFRVTWKIPKNGFKTKEKRKQWQDALFDKSFLEDEVRLRILREVDKQVRDGLPYDTQDIPNNNYYLDLPLVKYWRELDRLRIGYNFPPRWTSALQNYIHMNNIETLGLPIGVRVYDRVNQLLGTDSIIVEIDTNTSYDDYLKAWDLVKNIQKKLPKHFSSRRRPSQFIQRNRRAWVLYRKDKLPIHTIVSILEKEGYAPRVKEDIYDWAKSYEKLLDFKQS